MFFKLLVLILFLCAMTATLLDLRQQQVQITTQMARTTQKMQVTSQKLWHLQAQIAGHLQPHQLNASIARAQLQLEPLLPYRQIQDRRWPRLAGVMSHDLQVHN